MIDFLVKEDISDEDAILLLQHLFNLAKDEIVIYSLEGFENLTKKLPESCKCLGIKIPTKGDVCTLLQTYRVEIPFTVFLERLQSFCKKESITCYVSSNNFDDFYLITPNYEMVEVTQFFEEEADNWDEAYFVKKQ